MSKVRNTSGISLIVLILSIIIMAIIATIVITSNMGEDAVIIEAQDAIQKMNLEEKKNNLALEIENFKANCINNNQKFSKDMIVSILQKYGAINYTEGEIVSITTSTNDVILLSEYINETEEIDNGTEIKENSFNMTVGQAVWIGTSTPGFTVEVLSDYSIKINGTTSANTYIAFLEDETYMCLTNYDALKQYIWDNTPIISPNTNVKMTLKEITGTKVKPESSPFNFELRNATGGILNPDSAILLNMQLASLNNSESGYISAGIYCMEGNYSTEIKAFSMYIGNAWTFDNYIFKPTLEIVEIVE